jgi:hypothetical protein
MKIRIVVLTIIATIILASGMFQSPAHAAAVQEPTGLKNVRVWVNPEYDRSQELLVMIEGQITGTSAPAQVRFLIPTNAQMFSAGSIDTQGKYNNPFGAPSRTPSSKPGWDEISFQINYDIFRLEYYDATAIIGQPDKKVAVDFSWLYLVTNLTVMVQEPTNSSNYSVQPQGIISLDGDGLKIHSYFYDSLGVSDPPVHFDIAYTRSDSNPSIKNPALSSTIGSTGSTGTPIILFIIAIVIVIGGITIWVLKSRNTTRRRARSKDNAKRVSASGNTHVKSSGAQDRPERISRDNRDNRKMPSGAGEPAEDLKNKKIGRKLCSNCGEAVDNKARFCPNCGSRFYEPD